MIRAVIIDDESSARFLLKNLLERHFEGRVSVLAEADDVLSGIQCISEHKPDLVFLDIKMQNGTGFNILEKIEEIDFEVIFETAYDNYAIKAFEFGAFGYLLKPIKLADLKKNIERLEAYTEKTVKLQNAQVKELLKMFTQENSAPSQLVLSNMKGFTVVDLSDIVRLEASSNYTNFVLTSGENILTSKTIGDYEKLLSDHSFFRIHQSHIINLKHVREYIKEYGGQVKMTDGALLFLSRQRKPAFFRKFL